ncbi:thymidine phosphorylase family protein [Massilia sp. CCM 9210]|uniref:thymidine phosphorylase family protein n=1 Tax=Massilia scottii TaxID=3057166 RepID=UPI0027964305|nr:thymidine phosphorylase family protein [Massilia sp. CCM 9210]MDQ1812349.1 thymidine phosphorylase family protein [Massilia sp. CCM 9210]
MSVPVLRARRMGIDTYQERVAYMRSDCEVCKSEGFEARARIELRCGDKCVVATLNVVHSSLLERDEIGLSEAAWSALGPAGGAPVQLGHPPPLQSFSAVRGKIFGRPLTSDAAIAIVADVCAGRYSDIEMAALVTACSGGRMDVVETIALTRAMIGAGQRLSWDSAVVVDKHCVGGLPGNRTTLLVVPIVAACGLLIPKTSSRAITSPAGSADVMETLAPVTLDVPRMRAVVEREGGCIAWGGAVSLSPADDLLIRVERPLGLDSDGLLVASILSKKVAAGSTHVLIDIPVGRTAKVRSAQAAAALELRLKAVGQALGLSVQVLVTDGAQPVGCGIGPALEARDILAVLQGRPEAPDDLRQRALLLAGAVLEMGGKAGPGEGIATARQVLDSGAAWARFQAICEAQGGMREPPVAAYTHVVRALHSGEIVALDNRGIALLAKLAGAPGAAAAGISIHARLGVQLVTGDPLFTVHAESPGALAYALAYAQSQEHLVTIQQSAR